jgi:hypothetical protein
MIGRATPDRHVATHHMAVASGDRFAPAVSGRPNRALRRALAALLPHLVSAAPPDRVPPVADRPPERLAPWG